VMDKATTQLSPGSYVDDAMANDSLEASKSEVGDERKVQGTLGGAAFLITMAAELALGFLVGLFVKMRTDEDYAAWRKLKALLEDIIKLEQNIAELLSLIPRAKKLCMAGIRRAQSIRNKRCVPYHKTLALI